MEGVDSPICSACNQQVGDLYHRCCGRPASRELRQRNVKHHATLARAQSALHSQEPPYQHGVAWLKPTLAVPSRGFWRGGVEEGGHAAVGGVVALRARTHNCTVRQRHLPGQEADTRPHRLRQGHAQGMQQVARVLGSLAHIVRCPRGRPRVCHHA